METLENLVQFQILFHNVGNILEVSFILHEPSMGVFYLLATQSLLSEYQMSKA